MSNDEEIDYRQMRWASRRGMLELDLILGPFVEKHYPNLSADDKARYRALMGCQDQELFDWFLNKALPNELAHRHIIELILAAKRAAIPA
ncbi:MAG: succinate dehydrogenase assembly factor 2 [Pseudomonadota bacterium]